MRTHTALLSIAVSLVVLGWGKASHLSAAFGNNAAASTARELCPDARKGALHYRGQVWRWQDRRRHTRVGKHPIIKDKSCAHARMAAATWRKRARAHHRAYRAWYRELRWNSELAIRYVFGAYAEQAIRVAKCESGYSMTPRAENGQYLGVFQMGSSERATYGHGPSPLEQAQAAYRYFVASGKDWSPWSCKPW